MSKHPLFVLVLAGVTACASASPSTHRPRDYNLIPENEITAANGTNAYELITHLRPIFLKTRGRNSINNASIANEYASVFLDGQFFGDIISLRSISTLNIRDIRYLPANEAVTRYGMQYGSGVIDIRTK
jgi:hypothetical protein